MLTNRDDAILDSNIVLVYHCGKQPWQSLDLEQSKYQLPHHLLHLGVQMARKTAKKGVVDRFDHRVAKHDSCVHELECSTQVSQANIASPCLLADHLSDLDVELQNCPFILFA